MKVRYTRVVLDNIIWPTGHHDLPSMVVAKVETEDCIISEADEAREFMQGGRSYLERREGIAPISFDLIIDEDWETGEK